MHIDWRAALNLIGLSSLIGTVLSWWLTSRREHRRWALDNRKLEWRELIDTLHTCLWTLGYAFQPVRVFMPGEEGDVQDAMQNGFRVIRDRIFIADALQRHQVLEQWKELVAYVTAATLPREPGQRGAPTITEFNARGAAFEDKLLMMAREDLKL
jgi:hypothetical protein